MAGTYICTLNKVTVHSEIFLYYYIQAPLITDCTANIIMYNITVMDQYSPAIITVPANMSSVEISQFPDNGTNVVTNREYTITVSAISDQGTSYSSDPVSIGKYPNQNTPGIKKLWPRI